MDISDAAIIGGGPAGLFAAILLRRAYPDSPVTVYERHRPDSTFGFGVAFTRTSLRTIAVADQPTFDRMTEASVPIPPQEMRIGRDSAWSYGNAGAIGISRSALLAILTERATELGAEVRLGETATPASLSAQLVIAADGVGSRTRSSLGDSINAHVTPGRGVFMWLGCDRRLDSNLFAPVTTSDGLFNVHCYPYSDDRSTIGVEADVDTWRRAGMDRWTDETVLGESDVRSIEYLQSAFEPVLNATLLGNRSRWMHFRTVSVDRWHVGNVVLIGDAAHTAHYSVGAGTKMAMDDASTLVAALTRHPAEHLESALADYESRRRPQVERLQDLADRSRWWWESFASRQDLPVAQLMSAYMSRGGGVTTRKLAGAEPDLALEVVRRWAGELPNAVNFEDGSIAEFVFSRPLASASVNLTSRVLDSSEPDLRIARFPVGFRDPWGADADAAITELTSEPLGSDVVILSGEHDRSSLLDRLQFAERVRRSTAAVVGVHASSEYEDDIVDALIAERIDVVEWLTPATGLGNSTRGGRPLTAHR